MMASCVFVWSYLNARHLWTAYEPEVCEHLENLFASSKNSTTNNSDGQSGSSKSKCARLTGNGPLKLKTNLGRITSTLSDYEVDLVNMRQMQIFTGSCRPIQRTSHGPGSAFYLGLAWEFEGDRLFDWKKYDIETIELIEDAYSQRTQSNTKILDLRQTSTKQPYIIDFTLMTQTRTDTGTVRRIQRRAEHQPYPVATSTSIPAESFSASSASALSNFQFQEVATVTTQIKPKKASKRRSAPYAVPSNVSQTLAVASSSQTGVAPQTQDLSCGSTNDVQLQQLLPHSNGSQAPLTRRRFQADDLSTSTLLPVQQPSLLQQPSSLSQQDLQQQQYNQNFQQPQLQLLQQPHQTTYQQLQAAQPSSSISRLSMPGMHAVGVAYPHLPVGVMYSHLPFSCTTSQGAFPVTSSTSIMVQPPQVSFQPMSASSSTLLSLSPPFSPMELVKEKVTESLPGEKKIILTKNRTVKSKTGLEVLLRYMESVDMDLDKVDCCICFDTLSEPSNYGEGRPESYSVVQLSRCGHQFHKMCLLEMYNCSHKGDSLECPSCKTLYGEKMGNCPPGYMQWDILKGFNLPGYDGYDTIHVSYNIPSGVQGPEHPHPGQRYSTRSFPRQGFIPDCNQGRKVLKLLIEAFRRRLMFTIGMSHTTGEQDTVTWNEIHHKTESQTNCSGHGYPDPKYLDNVMLELAAHGVTEDCLT